MKKIVHSFKLIYYIISALLILFAILLSIARALTPLLEKHQASVVSALSNAIHLPIQVDRLQATWYRFQPSIAFNDVKILSADQKNILFRADNLYVGFSVWKSLWERQAVPQLMALDGVQVSVSQTDETHWEITSPKTAFHYTVDTKNTNADSVAFPLPLLPGTFHFILHRVNLNITNLLHQRLPIQGLDLHVKTQTKQLRAWGKIELNEPQNSLDFVVTAAGDLQKPADLISRAYLQGNDITLQQWPVTFFKRWGIQTGTLDFQLWADAKGHDVSQVQSDVEIHKLQLARAGLKPININYFSGNFALAKSDQQTTLTADKLNLEIDHQLLWKNNKIFFQHQANQNAFYIENYHAQDSQRFVAWMPASLQSQWKKLHPQGDIHRFYFQYNAANASYYLHAELEKLAWKASKPFPGLTGLNGTVDFNQNQGIADISIEDGQFNDPSLFSAPIPWTRFHTMLHAWRGDAGWHLALKKIEGNNEDDVSVNGNLSLWIPSNSDNIWMQVLLNLHKNSAKNYQHYIPGGILHKELVNWLSAAFTDFKNLDATVLIQGNTDNFPYDQNDGTFQVDAFFNQMILQFQPDWPPLTELDGEFSMDGRAITIRAPHALLKNIAADAIYAEIPVIKKEVPAQLFVTAHFPTDLEKGFKLVQESPLKKTLGEELAHFTLKGGFDLNLGLSISLENKNDPILVNGSALVSHAEVGAPAYDLGFSQLGGIIHFTESELSSENLQAVFLGKPIALALTRTVDSQNRGITAVQFDSHATLDELQKELHLPSFSPWLQGQLNYQATIQFPQANSGLYNKLILNSDLSGISVALPAPLGKKAEEKTPFDLSVEFLPKEALRLLIHYKNAFGFLGEFRKTKDQYSLYGANIDLDNNPRTTMGAGILLTGKIPSFDWKTWKAFADQHTLGGSNTTALRGIDVTIGQLNVLGQTILNTRYQITKSASAWNINLSGPSMNGAITLPLTSGQIKADFSKLYFANMKGSSSSMQNWPSLSFSCNDTRLGAMALGKVSFSLKPQGSGFLLQNLSTASDAFRLMAEGKFINNRSQFTGAIQVSNVEKFLANFGLPPLLSAKSSSAQFDLTWNGSLFSPTLSSLNGAFSINMGTGQILNLSESAESKLGIVRFLSFLSLQNLQRHLQSDPNASSHKAFPFDSIIGKFAIKNGNATTSNLAIKGPLADIDTEGRIGLAQEDYDLYLQISPHVTSSIPVVATIAGGPVVGVVSWFADKFVLGKAVGTITGQSYRMTGSWNNPTVTPLKKQEKK